MLLRLFDIIIALIGCLLLLIMLPVIALLIKLDSPGPVFYRTERVGKNGKIFKMYKFRTMFETDTPLGAAVCPQGDPRVTDFGRFLRRLKLNEFPQFINILKGDMSLVGPRPESPRLAAAYPPEAQKIFTVKPGLVGPNQILGRNEEELYPEGVNPEQYYLQHILPQKLPLDLQYIEDQSFLKNIKYLFLGIWVTISGAISRQHLLDNLTQIIMLTADVLGCLLSFTLAHLIRFEGFLPDDTTRAFLWILPFTVLTRIPFLFHFGCYQTLIRHLRMHDLLLVFKGVSLGSGVLIILSYLAGLTYIGTYARSVFVIDWLCLSVLLVGYRGLLKSRYQQQYYQKIAAAAQGEPRRTLIWGAGEEGLWCLNFLKASQNPYYQVLGFVDQDHKMRHRRIDGLKVLGDSHHLEILIQLYNIQEIFIADPNLSPSQRQRLQILCDQHNITLKSFLPPQLTELPAPGDHHLH